MEGKSREIMGSRLAWDTKQDYKPEKQNYQKRMRENGYYLSQLLIHEFTAKNVTHKA